MNTTENMLIANGRIITAEVKYCEYSKYSQKYEITFKNNKIYRYNYNSVTWLRNPQQLDPDMYKLYFNGRKLYNISAIYLFSAPFKSFWHICFEGGKEADYTDSELQISESVMKNESSKKVFDYLKEIADISSLKSDDGTKLLSKQYEKLSFIEDDRAIAPYLNPEEYKKSETREATPIFPFGCNASQFFAVKSALENQISVIEGPPGTGKTQTILNIIANLLAAGKTVQIVSNNNSATTNILEKLSSPKYGMGFIVAPLGNTENKESFIANQTGAYPDISDWQSLSFDEKNIIEDLKARSIALQSFFEKQERLAVARQELQSLETEQKHFTLWSSKAERKPIGLKLKKSKSPKSSKNFMKLWQRCQSYADDEQGLPFSFRLKLFLLSGSFDRNLYHQDIKNIITFLQENYYQIKQKELQEEITELEAYLSDNKAYEKSSEFTRLSMDYLKHFLFVKYGNKVKRPIFTKNDLFLNPEKITNEYPVVLSTTFSSISSLGKDACFDYLIMDEASQVDVATGALALSCAKNAVIVGDTKQLPNIVTNEISNLANSIFKKYQISKGYDYTHNSFLKSICEILPDIPKTLLKEHYRCHPKIIEFCNQKFYDGKLVIMTEDLGEPDVLSVVKTVQGNHQREHMNQRQIDVICREVLPAMQVPPNDIGIITPYRKQTEALEKAVGNPETEIDTVHKFQGREKEAIIISTVDNEPTDFSDDPYLLNVAVSRAKKKLCLVVSGNGEAQDSNIGDLISYIEYNNFSVTESKINSVFDYLYSQYTANRLEYLKKHRRVSEYDSENLMYSLICDVLEENGYKNIGVVCHQPLNMLINDPSLMNNKEYSYAMSPGTHLDFLLFNRVGKKPVLAIEVDGYEFHKNGTKQAERDVMKNHILELYNIPYLRFATNGSGEKEKLTQKLNLLLSK